MNDERRGGPWATPEDDLRVALAPDDTIAPLDPARVIAGARRRRKVQGLAAAGVAAVAVIGVAAGGFLAGGGSLDNAPQPADPGPTVPAPTLATQDRPTPRPAETPNASTAPPSGKTVGPEGTSSTATPPTVASCRQEAAASGVPAPGPAATQRGSLDGRLIIVADSNYWMACDSTFRTTPSARKPAKLTRPGIQDNNAFAVAGNTIDTTAGQRDFFWAAGMLPVGVATVRYSFVDGDVVDAEVSNGFWMMRHVSTVPPGAHDLGDRIRVQLLSPSGAVLNDVRLNWGTQTCAQISHGC